MHALQYSILNRHDNVPNRDRQANVPIGDRHRNVSMINIRHIYITIFYLIHDDVPNRGRHDNVPIGDRHTLNYVYN